MQGILASSFEAAENAGASKITRIDITVGELTEVVEFALQFAFEALTPDTIAEGATLSVTHLSPRSHCDSCGVDYDHDRFQMVCPECGSFEVRLLQGRELTIDAIETPDEPEVPDDPVTERSIADGVAPGGHVAFDPSTIEE